MKVLVTGGAGFIGSHLVERLVERGDRVTVLDDLSAGKVSNLGQVLSKIQFRVQSVEDYQAVHTITKGIDVIFHLATQCLVKGNEDPLMIHQVNDIGTYNVCVAAKEHGCKIVFIGTSEMYGQQTKISINEEAIPNPVSLYGMTKIVGEQYVRFFNDIYGVPAVCIRPFNTFGPRQREDKYSGVVTSFLKQIKQNKPFIIGGDGKQTRDFSYVSDIVEGILLLSELSGGEVVNLGSEKETSILELADAVTRSWLEKEDFSVDIVFEDPRINDLKKLKADVSLAKSYGYSSKVSLQEGMDRYVAWYKGCFGRV